MTLLAPFQQLLSGWSARADENAAVVEELALDNVRRLRWISPLVVVMNLAHVAVFVQGGGDPVVVAWKRHLTLVHGSMAAVVASLGLLAVAVARPGFPAPGARVALSNTAFGAGLLFALTVVLVDQPVTGSLTPFLLGCVLAGTVLLVRPSAAAAVYAVTAAAFLWELPRWQPNDNIALSNLVNGLSVIVLGFVVAAVTWRRTTANVLLSRKLATLATQDGLTGLLNRSGLWRLAEAELVRARRHGTETSLLLLDLDHFKRVNDQHGHPAGDAVLVHTAALLRDSLRQSDTVARLGGEEFAVWLPQTGSEAAIAVAEKLRRRLAESATPVGDQLLRVTASVGVATCAEGEDLDVDALYAECDRALYEAKSAGRDRVWTAGRSPVRPVGVG